VAALQYVQRGALELDGDVNQSLISWQVPANEFTTEERVTLRRLLSHSAGVTVEGFRGYAVGEELPNLRQILNGEWPANSPPIRVDIVPGTQHRYSGGGYMIVQQLLEDVVGKPFPDIMQESVLGPWEMAASMWATSSDLAQFAIRVMRSYVGQSDAALSPDIAIQMLTPHIENRGLGPLLYDEGGDLFYFMHSGANDGYKSVLVAYPERGQGVVIMTNGDNGDALWREILNSVSIEYISHADKLTQLYAGKEHFYGDIYAVEQKQMETCVIVKIEPIKVSLDAIFR
jgi:CubicO group peptidase (beta-lactamase class C family)